MTEATKIWYKALEPDELPEGRVKAVTCGLATVCMTHYEGQYAALDNECPHQRGPLGEGSIEKGFLRCPWHGKHPEIVSACRQAIGAFPVVEGSVEPCRQSCKSFKGSMFPMFLELRRAEVKSVRRTSAQ